MKKFISLFILICLICFSCSGSSDETEFSFQNNDVESEYKLFDLLDEYPSLKNIFENMDENEFNIKLSFLINPNIENIKEILPLMSELTSNDNKIINDIFIDFMVNTLSTIYIYRFFIFTVIVLCETLIILISYFSNCNMDSSSARLLALPNISRSNLALLLSTCL